MIIFARHFYIFRNGIPGYLLKVWVNNNINNTLAGIQHFFGKISWNKNGSFSYPEIQLTGMHSMQLL